MRHPLVRVLGAAAVVTVAAVALVAAKPAPLFPSAPLVVVPTVPSTQPIPPNQPVLLIFSVRNASSSPVAVANIQLSTAQSDSCTTARFFPPHLHGTVLPAAFGLVPGQQQQIDLQTSGFTPQDSIDSGGTESCAFQAVDAGGAVLVTFTVNIPLVGAPVVDIQPAGADFKPAVVEAQDFQLAAFGATIIQAIISGDDSTNSFAITSCSTADFSAHNCNFPIAAGSTGTLTITCTPNGGTATATLSAFGATSSLETIPLTCEPQQGGSPHIDIQQTDIALTGSLGATASDNAHLRAVNGTDTFSSAVVDVPAFRFTDARCTGGPMTCVFTGGLPLDLEISCTVGASPQTGVLTVTGGMSGDTDTANLTCTQSGSPAPDLTLTPSDMLVFSTHVAVGQTSAPLTLTVGNAGTAAVSGITLSLVSGTDFTISDCISGSTCGLDSGSNKDVSVAFTPHAPGHITEILQSSSSDSAHAPQIKLIGDADGAALSLVSSADADVDLGVLPRGQLGVHTVTLHDTGTIPLDVSLTVLTPPLGTDVGAVPATQLTLGAGSDGPFDITCGSEAATPGDGPVTQTLTATAAAAYQGGVQTIQVHCRVVDTDLHVDPTSFDFGEVRKGSDPVTKMLVITNPTTSSITLDAVALTDPTRPGISLSPAIANRTLAPQDSVTLALTLATAELTDLDADPKLAIDIGVTQGTTTTHLELPVHGKVVEASSSLDPQVLDLGTACVGRAITGDAVLSNTGTATILAQAPTVSGDFTLALTEPTSYPPAGAPIASHKAARATVTPVATTEGSYTGTLTWSDDASGVQTSRLSARYVATGTAVSPLALAFGTEHIGISAPAGLVTLENCGDTDVEVGLGSIVAVAGTPSAWRVDPHPGTVKVPAHHTTTLSVTFAPPYAGPYNASLQLVVDGEPSSVQLTGFADGAPIPRSFYGCGCASGGSPAGGWPIAGVLLALGVRRRRRVTLRCPRDAES